MLRGFQSPSAGGLGLICETCSQGSPSSFALRASQGRSDHRWATFTSPAFHEGSATNGDGFIIVACLPQAGQARWAVAIVAGGGSLRNLALSKPSPNGVTGLAFLSPCWGLVVIGYAFRALPDPARIEPTLRV